MNNISDLHSKKKEITPFNARLETKQSLRKKKILFETNSKKIKFEGLNDRQYVIKPAQLKLSDPNILNFRIKEEVITYFNFYIDNSRLYRKNKLFITK